MTNSLLYLIRIATPAHLFLTWAGDRVMSVEFVNLQNRRIGNKGWSPTLVPVGSWDPPMNALSLSTDDMLASGDLGTLRVNLDRIIWCDGT